ncbi:MAG: branched-chain amino acid ABC transporter permease [Betaproteobacteria bacterium]|nr:branched-chain amino acid ABC transporter permease [Betaproteobacteria bacterium]
MKLASDRALWVFAAAALALPIIADGNKFLAFVLGMTYISLLWATGMNLMYGFVGLMPLMFAGVAGIAGYAVVHLTRELGWSFWFAMPVATVMAALAGVALGLPSLRLKGFYFTLCSLVIQTVLTLAFIFFPTYTNGDTGINQIAPPDWFGGQLKGLGLELMIALFTVAGILLCAWIVRSPLGQRFVAIREDDILAEAIGIRVVRCKIIAFFIVSIYAGVGGCFYSVYIGFVSPRAFDVLVSMNIWLFVAFGGRGTIAGPIIGTAILAPIPFLLQDLQAFKDILSGVLIIVVTLLMPGGIYGAWLARRRRAQKAMTDSARVQESRV